MISVGVVSPYRQKMTYLIVGIDLDNLTPWHRNVRAADIASARRIASCWAQKMGINLAVAAVLGPNSNILEERRPSGTESIRELTRIRGALAS